MGINNMNEDRENSDNIDACVTNSPIQNFFSGSCVLVTGATGFVGKALVEKLLRSCPDLRTIYLLIRSKKGLNIQTRQKELLKNPVSITSFLWHCFQKGMEN
jgi:FlaA1/EpsC-like NDP-sugar epimerase